MHLNETTQNFPISLKLAKKSNSLLKDGLMTFNTSDGAELDNTSRVSSPETSFCAMSTQGKSVNTVIEESAIKLVKMDSEKEESDLTLPDINCNFNLIIYSKEI
jgi:hypothetical protein